MNIRKTFIALIALVLLSLSAYAQAGNMPATIVGVYDKLPGVEFKFDGKAVEVVEYMSFYCHTCYDFEKSIPIIRGNYPGKVKWTTVPIYWGDHGSPKPGEAYLIAIEMGKGEQMKKALFDAHMVQKKDIADPGVLEGIGKEVGLGPEFGKRLRAGEKSGEAQKALDMAKKVGINETPTVVIAGNLKTDPHPMNHDMDTFKTNIIAIIHSILHAK
jgi:hypothetical protein